MPNEANAKPALEAFVSLLSGFSITKLAARRPTLLLYSVLL